ncbi:MAG: BTAD domain-containing putative transcriptional regulator [Oscillospiraceae bacterium]
MSSVSADSSSLIKISMLGGFRLAVGERSVQDTDNRTRQLWSLLEYLIAYRHKTVSQEDIIRAMWPDNTIDNPANALKNLIYRIRTALTAKGIPKAKEMILYTQGSYCWNNQLDCRVDTEEFEAHCNRAANEELSFEEREKEYWTVLGLYTGNFLPDSGYRSWVVPISAYFRSLYFKSVYAFLEQLLRRPGREEDIQTVCEQALLIDQYEEQIHTYLLTALMRTGKQRQALSHYSYVTDLFFRELGVGPSAAMREVYKEIVKLSQNVEADLISIQDDLRETGATQGAFYCEYEVFKNLYRLEARSAARSGQSIFLSLLTLSGDNPTLSLTLDKQNRVMDALSATIQKSLRKGDVYSRFSASQYVLMLPTLTYENCEMVMNRILKRFRQTCRVKGISVHATIHPLDPVDE